MEVENLKGERGEREIGKKEVPWGLKRDVIPVKSLADARPPEEDEKVAATAGECFAVVHDFRHGGERGNVGSWFGGRETHTLGDLVLDIPNCVLRSFLALARQAAEENRVVLAGLVLVVAC
ncbi:hypothetical protein E2542_SST09519 [Spatholobus suberectus]|nr:hypothetical protein E2542_SST09519 [Spatholobus suberectus]